MRAAAISWLAFGSTPQPETDGIHLVWTGPELIELSLDHYRIQRRAAKPQEQCVTFEAPSLQQLRTQFEATSALGTFLFHSSPPFRSLSGLPLPIGAPQSRLDPLLQPGTQIDTYTLELLAPARSVRLVVVGKFAFAIGIAEGKAVDAQILSEIHTAGVLVATLTADAIDTIQLYALSMSQLQVCVVNQTPDDPSWDQSDTLGEVALPVQVNGANTANEWSAADALAHLLTNETIAAGDLANLGDVILQGLRFPEQGQPRTGARILLMRAATDQEFEEISYTDALAILRLSPRIRRVLGFAFADLMSRATIPPRRGVVYEYRISGFFRADDLFDTIWDVHAVPGGTRLPAAFRIRDLALRFAAPPRVVLDPPPPPGALNFVSRRGIEIAPSSTPWLLAPIGDATVVIDFPRPVNAVTLEVSAPGQLQFRANHNDPWSPLGGNNIAPLTLLPTTTLELRGSGTLFAIRIPSSTGVGIVRHSVEVGPISLVPTAPPNPPSPFSIANLQVPPQLLPEPIGEQTPVAPRPSPGFRLEWLPPPFNDIDAWPSDLDVAPLTDAHAYVIEHDRADAPVSWEPLEPGENLTFGTRDARTNPPPLVYGCDLDDVFTRPRGRRAAGAYTMHRSDPFAPPDLPPPPRAGAPLGSLHQYRIASMDVVGRMSATQTLSNVATLEKHLPPPLPCGPNETKFVADVDDAGNAFDRRVAPDGMYARAIVAGTPNLDPADLATLGANDDVVVVRWGWGVNERTLDPLAHEFRVYTRGTPPGLVSGTITSVSAVAGKYVIGFAAGQAVAVNECAGQYLTTGGQPFRIIEHSAGANPTIQLELSLRNASAAPLAGAAATIPQPIRAEHLLPGAWDRRIAVVPITASDTYELVLPNLLQLSPSQPRHSIWIGVSAADAEPYVPDVLSSFVPNGGRPGNEGAAAVASIDGRYAARPQYQVPDPIGDVPEMRTEEPTGRQVIAFVDLTVLADSAPGALQPGDPVILERCDANRVLGITSVESGDIVMRRKDDSKQTINVPDPNDRQRIIDVLTGSRRTSMETRYLLFLATQFTPRDELFERTSSRVESFGRVEDLLPPQPARYFYWVSKTDGAGLTSSGGAVLPLVVRVPSAAVPRAPEKVRLIYHHGLLQQPPGRRRAVGPGPPLAS
ncbi:MAG TPA: hypothetical protein VF713_13780, partial [Thermoanaerobaculia bacterium]